MLGCIQFSSVAQSCPTLCDPMDCSTPGFPVHHQLPELAHVHRVSDAINHLTLCHPLLFLPSVGVHVSFQISIFVSFRYILRGGIAGSYGSIIFSLCVFFFQKPIDCSHSSCTNLYSYQQCKRVPFFPHPCQHLSFEDFLTIAIPTSVRWYFIIPYISLNSPQHPACVKESSRFSDPFLGKVWSSDQHHWHHPGACWKCRISDSTPDLLNQNLIPN